jgi:gliding motility-associated lipoprotein GldD
MIRTILFFIIILIFTGCKEKYTPKPRSFFRIDFPSKEYHLSDNNFPYQFEIPDYSEITTDKHNKNEPYWINVSIPKNKAEIHISYYNIAGIKQPQKGLLAEFMEETRKLAYKHSIKADAIDEQIFINPEEKVYGTIYRIKGNAASPIQFFLTDSTNHFLRGAFYIREVPNIDSIKPVIDFFEPDIIRLIETTTWK